MSARRLVRRCVERLFGLQIIPPGSVALVFEEEHLRKFLPYFGVDCVFDVGANRGQYAQMLRTRAGFRGPIISYEPLPALARELAEAARRDGAWFVEDAALGEVQGETELNIYAADQFSSMRTFLTAADKRFEKASRLERRIKVRAVTLTEELKRYQSKLGFQRPFLKMDTQGCDLSVIAGAGVHIREFVGLQSELAIVRLYEGAPDYVQALECYRAHGFELSALVPNNLGHFPRLLEIDCIMFRAAENQSR